MAATNAKTEAGSTNDLRAARRAAGLSQQRVAEKAGCSLAAVALFESGYRPERSAVLPRILEVLNESSPAGEPGSIETISGLGVAGNVPPG